MSAKTKKYWEAEVAKHPGLIIDRVHAMKHVKLYLTTPDGAKAVITTSRTPGDYRALANFRADLRAIMEGRKR